MARAKAEIEVSASTSRLAAGLSVAASKFREFSSTVARGVGSAFTAINKKMEFGGTAKKALGNFGGDMLTRGFDKITETAGDVRNFERDLTRMGIAMNASPAQINGMRTAIRQASRDTGIGSDEILKASSRFYDLTGNADDTRASLVTFARTAQATGTDMQDLATLAAAAQDSMHVDPKEFEAMFSGLTNQGKAGAVSMREMAQEYTALLPRFAKFKGAMGVNGVLEMGAALQVAKKGFGTASEAATGLEATMGAMAINAFKFQAMGVRIYDTHKDGTKTFRSLHDIITDIGRSRLAKDPTLLSKALGSKEAEGAVTQLLKQKDMYDQMITAGQDAQTVQRDFATYTESDAGRLDVAMNRLKESIAAAFTPERIAAFTSAVEDLVGRVGPLVDALGKISDYSVGGLWGIGKSVRGAISGKPNVFMDGLGDENKSALRGMGKTGRIAGYATLAAGGKFGSNRDTAALEYDANITSFAQTRDDIMAGEVGDRTSKDSIRRAVIASYSDPTARGGGGQQRAGAMYLGAAGVTPDQQQKIFADAFKESIPEFAIQMAAAFAAAPPPIQKIGDNQVATAVNRSTAPRRAPAK